MMVGAGASQTQQPDKVEPIDGKVLDLVFRVEDMGGKVQSLEVKESPTEVRIDLAADVLFDFDKADILPKAQATLKQAAGVIHEKAHGAVRIEGHTDNVPIKNGLFDSNWELSSARATRITRL